MDRFLLGKGGAKTGVVASLQTCPREKPAGREFRAASFTGLARGTVLFAASEPQTLNQGGGNPQIGAAIDPVGGGGNACATTPAGDQAGTATYRLPPATGKGYTLLGAPTIKARLDVGGEPGVAQIAGRLWDVAPGGSTQSLVARGSFRPAVKGAEQVWQLHANGWHFARGHVPKLELLGSDPPSSRPSNGSFEITVKRLNLRLPVRERRVKRRHHHG